MSRYQPPWITAAGMYDAISRPRLERALLDSLLAIPAMSARRLDELADLVNAAPYQHATAAQLVAMLAAAIANLTPSEAAVLADRLAAKSETT